MGSPTYPTPEQVDRLNRTTALPPPEKAHLVNGQLTLKLEPNALVLITVPKH
jgi:xylan 1,4-beta-xylosidase